MWVLHDIVTSAESPEDVVKMKFINMEVETEPGKLYFFSVNFS